jgi:hypothetical protein
VQTYSMLNREYAYKSIVLKRKGKR